MKKFLVPVLSAVLFLGLCLCPVPAGAENSDRFDPEYIKMIEQKNMSPEEIYQVFGPGADGYKVTEEDSESLPANLEMTTKDPYTGATYDHGDKLNGAELRYGVDVSKWQGSVDWTKVKGAGISFAFIRLGHSWTSSGESNEDPYYQQNIINAPKAGLKVGVYYFSQATNESEARREAEFVLNLLNGRSLDLPVMFDYESNSSSYRNYGMSKALGTRIAKAFCERIRQGGYRSGVYANTDFFKEKLDGAQLDKENTIWVARYNTYAYASNYTEYIPNYTFWQYSGSDVNYYRGHIPGIGTSSTYSDLDFWYYRGEDLSSHPGLGMTTPETTRPPETTQPPTEPVDPPESEDGEEQSTEQEGQPPTAPETKPQIRPAVMEKDITLTGKTSGMLVQWKRAEGADSYIIYRAPAGGKNTKLATVSGDRTEYLDKKASYGTVYSYTVLPMNSGVKGDTSPKTGCRIAPLADTQVKASNAVSGVKVQWSKRSGATGYVIYRSEPGGTPVEIAAVSGYKTVSYTDTTAESGKEYVYAVCGTKSSYRGEKGSASILAIGSVPADSIVLKNEAGHLKVEWTPVKAAQSYRIYRKLSGKKYVLLTEMDASAALSYTDTDAVSGKTYYYSIRAVITGQEGSYTAKAMLRLAPLTADKVTLTNSSTGVIIGWKKIAGAAGYHIYKKVGDGSYEKFRDIKGGSKVKTTDITVVNGERVSYKVEPFRSGVIGACEGRETIHLKPVAVASIKNTEPGKAQVLLVAGNEAAETYEVQISTSASFSATRTVSRKLAFADLTDTLDGLIKGKTYYVRIRACKNLNGAEIHSSWSSRKTVKIRL